MFCRCSVVILYIFHVLWYNRYNKNKKHLFAQHVQKGFAMNEKAKEARRAYRREWAKKNPDKVRAITERYWTKKAQAAEAAGKEKASTKGA